ncbi:MAG: hypothetical protein IAE67_10100 [Candidatus Competibacteraceae bacterium]|nr:hypothetical protein [Candidatus Competibacteraceae bacterium]
MEMIANIQMYSSYNIEEIYSERPSEDVCDVSHTFLGWLSLSKTDDISRHFRLKKQQAIIEGFIRNKPRIQPVKSALTDLKDYEMERNQEGSAIAKPIVSETLARIYHQQKKYQLSIETYRQLSLVNPEKSNYFASLIKKIEKEQEKP